MDAWIDQLATEPLGRLALHQAFAGALTQFFTFTLVLIRMSGLMVIGPIFGQASVPVNIRVLLAIAFGLLLTPLQAERHQRGWDVLDGNADGQLTAEEIPAGLLPHFERRLRNSGVPADGALQRADDRQTLPIPESIWDYARIAAGELILGLLLGTGVMTVISGLQIAGQLIDQQSGLGLGEIFNPDLGGSVSITGQTLLWLGTAVLLMLSPLGGHLLMVRILAETFDTMPVGEAVLSSTTGELLMLLIQQSLLLGLRVAAPVMVMMSLIDLTLGFLNHSVPQINIQAVGFSLRAVFGTLILMVTLTSVSDAIVSPLIDMLDVLRESLVFPR